MPNHVTRVKDGKTRGRRNYWVAICTCGWHSGQHAHEHEAQRTADSHLWDQRPKVA